MLQEKVARLQREKEELFEQLKETEAQLLARDIELANTKSRPPRGQLPLVAASLIGAAILFALLYFNVIARR